MFKSQVSMRKSASVLSYRLLWLSCPTNPLQSTLVLPDLLAMLRFVPTLTITTTPTTATIIKDHRATRDQWTQARPRAGHSNPGTARVVAGLEVVVVQVLVGH